MFDVGAQCHDYSVTRGVFFLSKLFLFNCKFQFKFNCKFRLVVVVVVVVVAWLVLTQVISNFKILLWVYTLRNFSKSAVISIPLKNTMNIFQNGNFSHPCIQIKNETTRNVLERGDDTEFQSFSLAEMYYNLFNFSRKKWIFVENRIKERMASSHP